MRFSVLLLLGIHLACARKHSLKYFYTSVSENDDEFTAAGLVDDRQFMYFNISTMKASPKTDWIRPNEKADYWNRQTESLIHQHYWIRKYVWKSAGMHTYQITYGCEWNDETGKTSGFRRYGYDGEDFLSLNLKKEEWISPMEEGFNAQQECNNKTLYFDRWKYYLETECIETLKKILQLGKSSLEKTVSPQVSLLQKNGSFPVLCHVTDFYPSNVMITWMKNGQKHYDNVTEGTLLPNEDGTYQKTVTLEAEPDEWRKNQYSCVVKHQSKTIRKTLTEDKIRTNNEQYVRIGIVGSVFGTLLLFVIAVLGYLVYQKKLKSGYATANSSDSGSCQTEAEA